MRDVQLGFHGGGRWRRMCSRKGNGVGRDQSGRRRATTSYWARRRLQLVGQAELLSSTNHILIPIIMDPVNHLFSSSLGSNLGSNPYPGYRTSFPSSLLFC